MCGRASHAKTTRALWRAISWSDNVLWVIRSTEYRPPGGPQVRGRFPGGKPAFHYQCAKRLRGTGEGTSTRGQLVALLAGGGQALPPLYLPGLVWATVKPSPGGLRTRGGLACTWRPDLAIFGSPMGVRIPNGSPSSARARSSDLRRGTEPCRPASCHRCSYWDLQPRPSGRVVLPLDCRQARPGTKTSERRRRSVNDCVAPRIL